MDGINNVFFSKDDEVINLQNLTHNKIDKLSYEINQKIIGINNEIKDVNSRISFEVENINNTINFNLWYNKLSFWKKYITYRKYNKNELYELWYQNHRS